MCLQWFGILSDLYYAFAIWVNHLLTTNHANHILVILSLNVLVHCSHKLMVQGFSDIWLFKIPLINNAYHCIQGKALLQTLPGQNESSPKIKMKIIVYLPTYLIVYLFTSCIKTIISIKHNICIIFYKGSYICYVWWLFWMTSA